MCREDDPEQLIAQLGTYLLDVVIANAPAPAYLPIKVFNHLLGESAIAFFAPAPLSSRLKRRFPKSLAQGANAACRRPTAPFGAASRSGSTRRRLRREIVGEFEDSALMNVFGHAAGCAFPAPSAIAG